MFDFIKKLFHIGPKFSLGAHESPQDSRNIDLASFQPPVALPDQYESPMPPVEDQGARPKCVGSAISKLAELYFLQKGITVDLSDDDLYDQCKLEDGLSSTGGTYPSVGAKIVCRSGMCTQSTYITQNRPQVLAERAKYKLGGYAFVTADFDSICQAIYQNHAITASFAVDNNWFVGVITRVLKAIGRHYVVVHGFSRTKKNLIGQNSWGSSWTGFIAGLFNPQVKQGHFEVLWDDVKDNIMDIISFTDIPPELLKKASDQNYIFTKNLKIGDRGYDVRKLIERLSKEGVYHSYFDDIFGLGTQKAVQDYQRMNNISPTGNVYELTRACLNGTQVVVTPVQPIGAYSLYPLVQRMSDELIKQCVAVGHAIKITEGYRSADRQNNLYAQGRTKPGNIITNAKGGESLHQYHIAFDVAFVGSTPYPTDRALWQQIGAIGKKIGLEWGGDFSTADQPHFEMKLSHTLIDFQNGTVDYSKYE